MSLWPGHFYFHARLLMVEIFWKNFDHSQKATEPQIKHLQHAQPFPESSAQCLFNPYYISSYMYVHTAFCHQHCLLKSDPFHIRHSLSLGNSTTFSDRSQDRKTHKIFSAHLTLSWKISTWVFCAVNQPLISAENKFLGWGHAPRLP